MEQKRLGDIATYINGYAFKPEDRGSTGLPIIRIQDLTGNAYDLGFYDGKYPEKIEINDGDVLISWSASLGVYIWNRGKGLLNQHIFKVVFDKCEVNKQYFVFAVKYKLKEMELKTHGATMKHIVKKDFDNTVIPFPTVEKQADIAYILSKIESIVEFRQQELQQLDDLMKARFVEMFGDIKTNEYGWEKCTFKDVSTKITDGEHGTVPRVDEGEGYLYFMARNITKEGEIDLSETSFVPREIHEKIYKRCNPEKDDLLLVCVGATIGKCTLVSEIMGEFSMARSVALIKPNKEMVTSNFLINLLRSEAIQNDIDHCSHAAAQAGLYTNMINSLEAFVPPMDLQIEFDTFCEQVYKSKVAVQKALDETQLLFDSLMQEYFG